MDPETIKAALQQVLAEMGGAARGGLAKKFMGASPAGLSSNGTTDDGLEAPPDAMSGAEGAALDALAGDGDGPDDECDPSDPTDDEMEELAKSSK